MDNRKGCPSSLDVVLWQAGPSAPDIHNANKKTGDSRLPMWIHLAFNPPSRWNETDISLLNGAREGRERFGRTKVRTRTLPAFFLRFSSSRCNLSKNVCKLCEKIYVKRKWERAECGWNAFFSTARSSRDYSNRNGPKRLCLLRINISSDYIFF